MVVGLPELLGEIESDTRNVLLTLVLRAPLVHARAVYLGAAEEDWTGVAGVFRQTAAGMRDAIDGSGG